MRYLAATALALAASTALAQTDGPVEREAEPDRQEFIPRSNEASNCQDRIEQVRAANGQPQLERGTTSSDDAMFIAAVDKRIDGCAVMVMRADTSDIRPLPERSDEVRLRPLD